MFVDPTSSLGVNQLRYFFFKKDYEASEEYPIVYSSNLNEEIFLSLSRKYPNLVFLSGGCFRVDVASQSVVCYAEEGRSMLRVKPRQDDASRLETLLKFGE